MDPTTLAQATAAATALFGPHVAALLAAACVLVVLVAHGVMPWAPVPSTSSPALYRTAYAALRFVAGNYHNAAPVFAAPVFTPK